ncbi:IGR protein [Cordyceps fumosorosea ARSEF 2679]|uniref:Small ribosomal subunit protein mS41 n=1 Tax=Cordyceps fumosorosea (strain ARSEF 2679) TaxID=1081104 RepID=A0A162JNQ0_CORFA|nr:IGR protein [Cordyceps fumosorosea ARSEF 2679]OAA71572.1 IGR protein [Cordyceps fumosorosea ARSEF 2679]
MRAQSLWSSLRPLASAPTTSTLNTQIRCLHKTRPPPTIPRPRPFVPDVETFLKLIGRGLSRHASKFPTWEALFAMTSPQLKELGVEPPRARRYLLQWMQRYRKGVVGPGGDFQFVRDGEAHLRVALPPAGAATDARWVVNVPHDGDGVVAAETYPRPKGYSVRGLTTIAGSHATELPGKGGAVVKVTEGMWEQKQGRKIDGGERRRAETRFKKRSAERRAEREAELMKHL